MSSKKLLHKLAITAVSIAAFSVSSAFADEHGHFYLRTLKDWNGDTAVAAKTASSNTSTHNANPGANDPHKPFGYPSPSSTSIHNANPVAKNPSANDPHKPFGYPLS